MKPTTIMSRANWLTGTAGRNRSASLTEVDTALLMWESCTNNQWPEDLKLVQEKLDIWIALKLKSGKLKTHRNHATVTTLKSQLDDALEGQDAKVWSGEYPPVFISTDASINGKGVPDQWAGNVQVILGNLNSDARGKELLKMLSLACETQKQRVVIAFGANQCAPCTLKIIKDNNERLWPKLNQWISNPSIVQTGIKKVGESNEFIGNSGSSAIVFFNPEIKAGPDGERPSWVALGHELIHAYHYVTGTCARALTGSTNTDSGISEEEMQTIGIKEYKNQIPTENWLRESAGCTERTKYSGYDFADTKCTLYSV